MKVAFLVPNLNYKEGWGRYVSDLVFGIENSGCEVIILKEQDDGFRGIPILKSGIGVFFSAIKIRKYLKNCDIVHALDGYPYGVIAALANLGLKKKLIITAVGSYAVAPLYDYKTSFLLKWAYKKADRVVAISNYTKEQILKKIKPRSIGVINLGVNLRNFSGKHIDFNKKFILGVGALKERKGYQISIQAFALARKQISDLEYIIVGNQQDAGYFKYLKDLAVEHKVEKYVKFLTNIPDEELHDLYSRAKLFVLTSVNVGNYFEGFGLVFLEAAAFGLPVVGTVGNGIEDAVENNLNGILVEQNNIKKTADAMLSILKNENTWQSMSKNSYFWAPKNDLNNAIDKYLKVYKL